MKSKIKKRVDENRSNSTGLVLLWFIFFVLIVSCGILYLNKDKIILNFKEKKEVSSKVEDVKDGYTSVDIDSPSIKNLFNLVHRDFLAVDEVLYGNKKLNVSEMEDYYKFGLASNLYTGEAVRNNYALENEITAYIDENVVKDKYEIIFGKGTYKKIDLIPYSCTDMHYDTVNIRYVTTNQACGVESPFNAHEKIIKSMKKDKELLIVGAVVFSESYTGSLCSDYECKNIIDNYSSRVTNKEYFYDYIDDNLDKLQQYTYKFKLNDDGFYYYQGFERTKE